MKELKTRFQKYVDSGSIASRAVESVWRYLLLLVPALFLAALCAGCGQGNALSRRVYWTDVLNHKIQRADVNCLRGPGANACIETVLDTLSVVPAETGHPGAKSPNSVVVDSDGGWIYWSEFWTGIHRTTLDGQSTQTIVPTPRMPIHDSWFPPVYLPGLDRDTPELLRADIQGIDIDPVNKRLYFGPDHPFESPLGSKYLNPNSDLPFAGARIWSSNLDGSLRVKLLSNSVDGFPGSLGLDLTNRKMYWGSPTSGGYPHANRLMRADLSGNNMETFLLLDGSEGRPWLDPRDVAVDEAAGRVYFTSAYTNSIWRVKADGTDLRQLIRRLDTPQNIVLDVADGKMYFAEVSHNVPEGAQPRGGAVSRANLNGSGYERLVTGSSFPAGTFTADFPFAPNGIALVPR